MGDVNPRELGKARHLAHNGAQWLARIAHSYVDPASEDAHTGLEWVDDGSALVTQEIDPGLVLELRLSDLVLQFKEEGERVAHQLELDDRSPAHVEAWLLVELLHRGVDRDRFSKDLPYAIPGLMTGDAKRYSTELVESELREFSTWYANAASVLDRVRRDYASPASIPSPIKCWPHSFDMATLISLDPHDTPNARAIRVGFAPGDGYYGEPYFYVTPSSRLAPENLPILPEIGHWHTKDFVGAILTASQIIEKNATGDEIVEFLSAAISAGRERLGA